MKVSLTLVCVCAAAVMCFAQSNGRIIGSLTGNEGEPIEDARLTLSSDSLISSTVVTYSNSRGFFRFSLLPLIGEFTLTVEKDGYKTVTVYHLRLDHDGVQSVNLTLEPLEFEDVITITAEPPMLDKKTSSIGESITNEHLQSLPFGRNIWGVANFLAGFTDDSAFGSVRQSSQAYTFDGINMTDPATGYVFSSVNLESVEQVNVTMFGANAEYGSFTGASINVVTKSGGNEFHGESNIFTQQAEWVGNNTYAYTGLNTPTSSDVVDVNVAIGGPLQKDRIWFFTNIGKREVDTLRTMYTGPVTVTEEMFRLFGKLSLEWNTRNKSYGSWTKYYLDRSHRLPSSSSWIQFPESSVWKQDSEIDSYFFQNDSIIYDNLILSARFAGFFGGFDLNPRKFGPTIYYIDKQAYADTYNYITSYDRNRMGALVTASCFIDETGKGNHDIKLGLEYSDSLSRRFISYEDYEIYTFDVPTIKYNFGTYESGTVIDGYSFFVQDSWSVDERLTFNYGFRFDRSHIRAEKDNGGLADGTEPFITFDDPAVRIGFSYDLTDDNRTLLKMFYGRFYEGVVTGNTESMVTYVDPTFFYKWSGTGWVLVDSYGGSEPGAFKIDDTISNQYTEGFVISIERQIQEDIVASASFVYKTDENIIGTIAMYNSWTEAYADTPWYSGIYYDNYSVGQTEYYTNPGKDNRGVNQDLTRKYWGYIFEINKKMRKGWSLKANYVYARNVGTVSNANIADVAGYNDFSNPNMWINVDSSSRLPLDIPHTFKAISSMVLPSDFLFSSSITFKSGRPYSPTILLGEYLAEIHTHHNRGSDRFDNQLNIDLRLEKTFTFDRYHLGLIAEIYNALNDDSVTNYWSTVVTSARYLVPSEIVPPRSIQLGARLTF